MNPLLISAAAAGVIAGKKAKDGSIDKSQSWDGYDQQDFATFGRGLSKKQLADIKNRRRRRNCIIVGIIILVVIALFFIFTPRVHAGKGCRKCPPLCSIKYQKGDLTFYRVHFVVQLKKEVDSTLIGESVEPPPDCFEVLISDGKHVPVWFAEMFEDNKNCFCIESRSP